MGTNPYQGQNADQSNQYGGYTGYTPPSQGSTGGYQQPDPDYQYGQQQQQQQYAYTYQAPISARRGGTSNTVDPSAATSKDRKFALFSYLFIFLGGLVFFVIERKNQFVRFCAAQSFLFFGAVTVLYVLLRLISIVPLVGFLLSPIVGCAMWVVIVPSLLIWLFLMLQAYRGVKVKLPFFGDYAEGLVARFTKP